VGYFVWEKGNEVKRKKLTSVANKRRDGYMKNGRFQMKNEQIANSRAHATIKGNIDIEMVCFWLLCFLVCVYPFPQKTKIYTTELNLFWVFGHSHESGKCLDDFEIRTNSQRYE
jgi:hypothetical protein